MFTFFSYFYHFQVLCSLPCELHNDGFPLSYNSWHLTVHLTLGKMSVQFYHVASDCPDIVYLLASMPQKLIFFLLWIFDMGNKILALYTMSFEMYSRYMFLASLSKCRWPLWCILLFLCLECTSPVSRGEGIPNHLTFLAEPAFYNTILSEIWIT